MSVDQDDELSVGEPAAPLGEPLTLQEAHRAIGRWVQILPGQDPGIIIRVSGTGVLVRHAGCRRFKGSRSHYAWCSLEGLRRRRDWDRNVDPDWLQVAVSRGGRGTPDLHPIVALRLHPEFPIAVDDKVVYETYAKERGLSTGPAPERLLRVFEDAGELEARYQEELELQRELDAKLVRGE